ncbi:hypothetical protein N0V82_005283 [Gnomoniopsis sp. IMI 355080]|nr:hypothetical protein N0V82_005283 [Gnomoniopsis sp. IMI 355080]
MDRRKTNKTFMDMMPYEGLYYQYYRKFDVETAAFITSGTNLIKASCKEGREIPEGADFWGQAKKHTFLESVKDITAYHFALKLMEARKRGLERYAQRALEKGLPESNKFDALTAKALDGFMAAVEVASVMSPFQASELSAFMNGNLAQDLVPSEDDADDEAEYDAKVEVADNLSVQPLAQDSTQGVKLPTSGNWWDVATGNMNGGVDSFMAGMEDEAEYDNDDQWEIDDEIDMSEDEFGMKGNRVLENIEAEDALRMYCRDNNTVVAMEDFVDTPIAKQIMAERAPWLTGLLNATVIAKDGYEHDLEKHLLRRANLTPEQMQQREDNRSETWERFRAFCKEKDAEEAMTDQAARLSLSAHAGQEAQEDEEDEEDEDENEDEENDDDENDEEVDDDNQDLEDVEMDS